MIPTYNSVGFLRETLASVLAQDPGPELMQIRVVDDASTMDDPEAVVAELGGGRLEFYRQPHNLGHVRNLETCILQARGHLVHVLHGDDRVRPGFYRAMQRPFDLHPGIGAAFCRQIYMDERGHWFGLSVLERSEAGVLEDWLTTIAAGQRLQAPAMVVRREVYEHLGGFDRRIQCVGEDWEMWVRIAAHYPVWYEPEPLAEYRRHPASLTRMSLRTGQNLRDLRHVVEITRDYLPPERAANVFRRARERCALWGLDLAGQMLSAGEWRTALVQVREALRCSHSVWVMLRIVRLLIGLLAGPTPGSSADALRGIRRNENRSAAKS